MRVVYAAILLLFVVAAAIFCYENFETVSLSFLGWKMSLPLPVLALIIYLIGMVSGYSLLSFLRRTYRRATEPR